MQLHTEIILYSIVVTIFKTNVARCKKQDFPRSFEIDENLLQKRCELICYGKSSGKCTLKDCIDNLSKLSKPGHCPNTLGPRGNFECLQNCQKQDYECPGTKKCCHRDCGWTCLNAIGLDLDSMLPPIPFNVTAAERRKTKRTCDITWHIHLNNTQLLPIYFVVEVRSHIGSIFSQRKFGDWHWYNFHKIADAKNHKTHTQTTVVSIKLRTGRWYQFRVAAINEYGFRGYSNISKEFRLTEQNHIAAPKPPQSPKNFTVGHLKLLTKDLVYAKASWNAPKSDLPIEKYKISWALYLKAENDSLFMNEACVKEPIRSFEFWNLSVNSIYYLQVQAISINGKKRLKSSKESKILNTTLPLTINSYIDKKHSLQILNSNELGNFSKFGTRNIGKTRQPEIIVRFIANKKFGMLVRVIWNEFYRGSLLELCTGSIECTTREYSAVKPRKDHIDFGKLKFDTQYTTRLTDPNNPMDGIVLMSKTFRTPTCENWVRKFPNLNITCP